MANGRFVTLALFLLAPSRFVSAGSNIWTSAGPPGEVITSVAVAPSNPNVIYVGSASGPN